MQTVVSGGRDMQTEVRPYSGINRLIKLTLLVLLSSLGQGCELPFGLEKSEDGIPKGIKKILPKLPATKTLDLNITELTDENYEFNVDLDEPSLNISFEHEEDSSSEDHSESDDLEDKLSDLYRINLVYENESHPFTQTEETLKLWHVMEAVESDTATELDLVFSLKISPGNYHPLFIWHLHFGEPAIYVSDSKGNDSNIGLPFSPVKTISNALTLAKNSGISKIRVSAGTFYEDSLRISDGLNLLGGHGEKAWVRNSQNYISTIYSGNLGLTISAVTTGVSMDGFTINSGSPLGSGKSSYAIRILDSLNVSITANKLFSGNGSEGNSGIDGLSGKPGKTGSTGANGRGSEESIGIRTATQTLNPGDGGKEVSTCSSTSGAGGKGGWGEESGEKGSTNHSGFRGGSGGYGSLGGRGSNGISASNGYSGSNGDNAQRDGHFLRGEWIPQNGTNGQDSAYSGFFGGGGGGGGGFTNGIISVGGGGGGSGGSGGCPGTGGSGAHGGGGSFGILIFQSSNVILSENKITTSNGGNGGSGGKAGRGGDGGRAGVGGLGGMGPDGIYAGSGGNGGNGGNGGKGGSGGSGAGGPSVGVLLVGQTQVNFQSNIFIIGKAGRGAWAGGNSMFSENGVASEVIEFTVTGSGGIGEMNF